MTPFDGGWTFETAAFDVADAEWLTFARVKPVCAARKGGLSNIVEDDDSAVVVRGYSYDLEMNETDWRGINERPQRRRAHVGGGARRAGAVRAGEPPEAGSARGDRRRAL